MRLYLFDFDGTLTTKDSLFAFLRFVAGPVKWGLSLGLFLPHMVLMKAGGLSNSAVKERLIAFHLKGRSAEELEALAEKFHQLILPGILRPNAMVYVREVVASGQEAALVSASMDLWLRPFAHAEGLKLICTEGAFENGRYTGRFAGPNCHGPEKANRIRAAYPLANFTEIYAFGDSSGDKEMLDLATEKHYRFFEG